MRVLLMNQFFWPDLAPTGQLAADLTQHLTAQGHTVTVICSRAMYAPAGVEDLPGVRVIRCAGPRFSRTTPLRMCSYAAFLLLAPLHAIRIPRPDVVITLSTPPLLSFVGALLKRIRSIRHVIWEMDLYPELAVELGFLRRGSPFTRIAVRAARFVRNHSDGVLVLGECMKERLVASGVATAKVQVVENWADGTRVQPVARTPERRLNILYSGNLGIAHDIETVKAAITRLKADERFHFTFVGHGAHTVALRQYCTRENCQNVSILPYQSRDEFSEILSRGDIGLVTQHPRAVGLTVPSKTYSLMAAGRPVLFVGPRQATVGRIVERHACGWQVDCGDVQGFVDRLTVLYDGRDLLRQAGAAAREAFANFYDLPFGVSRIANILECFEPPAALKTAAEATPAQ